MSISKPTCAGRHPVNDHILLPGIVTALFIRELHRCGKPAFRGTQNSPPNRSSAGCLQERVPASGWQDSNLRPPAPKAGAIPGYATPRKPISGTQLSKKSLRVGFPEAFRSENSSVGVAGFEPTTSSTPCWRDTRLRYTPMNYRANVRCPKGNVQASAGFFCADCCLSGAVSG